MHKYKAFGLNIASEMEISDLLPCDTDETDVMIRMGKVPDVFDDVTMQSANRKIGKDRFLLDNKNIAKFYVEKGSLIIAEPYCNSLFEEIKLYLLGSCMGALLYQRKTLPLHGSCIQYRGKGVLLTGKSGAGKSTIASALFEKGCTLVTDDVAAIKFGESGPFVYPSYPSQKLWEDAIRRMGKKGEMSTLVRVSDAFNKYSVVNRDYFTNIPTHLKVIFEILPAAAEKMTIEEIKGSAKVEIVVKNTYRRFMTKAMGLKEWHFHQCVAVADKTKIYRITRPQGEHLENEIAAIVFEKLKSAENE